MDGGSYTEIAGGKIIEIYEDDYSIYAGGNIITSANKGINEVGEDTGVSFGQPADPPKQETKDSTYFIKGWWTDLKNTEISDAFFGQTVRFHISTKDIDDGELIILQFCHYGLIFDTKMGAIKTIVITNNTATIDFTINKKWNVTLDSLQDEKEKVRFFCKSIYKNDKADLGEYLNVANKDNAIVFYIGGAADKYQYYFQGPNHNIQDAEKHIEKKIMKLPNAAFYEAYYMDYSEAHEDSSEFAPNVLKKISNKTTPIYIIGHSLGAWNGAHLSTILNDYGYTVEMLITLDPVGDGTLVYVGSKIYYTKPSPKANFWINIKTAPAKTDSSDDIAQFGEQWNVIAGPNINVNVNLHHYDALGIFTTTIANGKSAEDYFYDSVSSKL